MTGKVIPKQMGTNEQSLYRFQFLNFIFIVVWGEMAVGTNTSH